MARLLDHLTLALCAYVLAYVLASVEPLSNYAAGPSSPVVALTVLFFLAAGYHSGRRLPGGRTTRPSRSPSRLRK